MSVLAQILERKRADLAGRMQARPLASLRDAAEPTGRDLAAALARPRTGFILECKAASPSAGTLRADYDPVAVARAYAPFADALSVLCDGPFFGGSIEHLAAVSAQVPLPVLCKDFVVHPYQVYEARVHGADGILLMLSVLDDETWRACRAACDALGMTPLTEVRDEAELARALALDAPVIGINNRNLDTLQVDLATTERLAPKVPPDRVLVSESGITSHRDVLHLRGQVDAFLVGSALMRAERLDLAVRALIFGRVKICGLRRAEDVFRAWELGASYGGFVFAQSRRRITEVDAGRLRLATDMPWVGVSVDDPVGWLARRAQDLGLAALQLHGGEDPGYVRDLRDRVGASCEIWKAQRVRSAAEVAPRPEADRLLLDTYRPGVPGGTGSRFDWRGLAELPGRSGYLLAGGITPDNVAEADALGFWALDVSSGVEAAPGVKDPDRLAALFAALRGSGRVPTPQREG